jgi:hypothetical protein
MALQLIKNFLSRKLIFSTFAVVCILLSIIQAAKLGLSDNVLLVVLPTEIICVTIICVSFVTGLAKIDIAASAVYGKKD